MSKFTPLKHKLECHGWSVSTVALDDDAWWALEIWALQSTWRPNETVVYLSLMLDPDSSLYKNNPKDTDVWCVHLTSQLPKIRLVGKEHRFTVHRNFEKRIDEIVAAAEKLRKP